MLTPLRGSLKYEKVKRKITNNLQIRFFINNLGCYSKIESAKYLGIFMLKKSVSNKFWNTLWFSKIPASSFLENEERDKSPSKIGYFCGHILLVLTPG